MQKIIKLIIEFIPFLINTLAINALLLSDRIILANFSNTAFEASIFTMNVYNNLYIFFSVFISSISVIIIRNKKYNKSHIGNNIWQLIWIVLIGCIFFVFFGSKTAKIFIPLDYYEYGKTYYNIIISFGGIALFTSVFKTFYIITDRINYVVIISILSNIMNLILNIVLVFGIKDFIPSLGILGAGIATIIVQIIEFIIFTIGFLSKTNKQNFNTCNYKASFNIIKKFLFLGLPSGLTQFTLMLFWTSLVYLTNKLGEKYFITFIFGETLIIFSSFFLDSIRNYSIFQLSHFIKEKLKVTQFLNLILKLYIIFCIIIYFFIFYFSDSLITFLFKEKLDIHAILKSNLKFIGLYIFIFGIVNLKEAFIIACKDTFALMVINFTSSFLTILIFLFIFYFYKISLNMIWPIFILSITINYLITHFRVNQLFNRICLQK